MLTGLEVVMLAKGILPRVIAGFHRYVTPPLSFEKNWASILPKAYSFLTLCLYVIVGNGFPAESSLGVDTNLPVVKFELLIALMKFEVRVVVKICGE